MHLFKKIIRRLTYYLSFIWYSFYKIDENLFVFLSDGDFCDNARALYEYMIANNLNEKYKLVWIVKEPKIYEKYKRKNVQFIKTFPFKIRQMMIYNKTYRTARYFFFTHGGYKRARKGQTIVNLWHGSIPMKAMNDNPILYKTFDYQTTPSYTAAERMSLFTGVKKEQAIINSDCRQDYLFSDCENKVKAFLGKNYSKYIIGMPTFKKSKAWTDATAESWILPVIHSANDFDELNAFCVKENILLILKIHHLEDTSFLTAKSLSNIKILKDEELKEADIQLYELIGKMDAMLTDFSSVAYDFMLLDKPIGYMIAGIKNYTRGFIVPNIETEMAGEKIKTIEDLRQFMINVKSGKDCWHQERKTIIDKFFTYQKDGNCERLLNILGITQ